MRRSGSAACFLLSSKGTSLRHLVFFLNSIQPPDLLQFLELTVPFLFRAYSRLESPLCRTFSKALGRQDGLSGLFNLLCHVFVFQDRVYPTLKVGSLEVKFHFESFVQFSGFLIKNLRGDSTFAGVSIDVAVAKVERLLPCNSLKDRFRFCHNIHFGMMFLFL